MYTAVFLKKINYGSVIYRNVVLYIRLQQFEAKLIL